MRTLAAIVNETLVLPPTRQCTQGPLGLCRFGRNRKRKRGARSAVVRLGPETSTMSLDDGTAEREADTHAVALRRVKGVEHLADVVGIEACPAVTNGHTHTNVLLTFGS